MPQVTEIAYIPFKSGDASKVWEETLSTVKSLAGVQSIFWGHQIEHPDVVQLAVDWESLEVHQAFMKSPAYAPFLEKLTPLVSGAPELFHVHLPASNQFSGPGSAPVTECISFYFAPDYPNATFENNWKQLCEKIQVYAKEAQGVSGGWVVEEVTNKKGLGEDGGDGKGKMFWAVIGWPSVEAHMKFRETEEFKEIIPHLMEGPKVIEMHHVKFQKY